MESLFNICYWLLIIAACFLGLVLLPYDIYRRKRATDLKERRMLEQIMVLNVVLTFLLIVLISLMNFCNG